MENASKALIIAGAILLAILIIGLGVFIFNKAKSATNMVDLDNQQVEAHNSTFQSYEGTINGTQAKALIDAVRNNNQKMPDLGDIAVNGKSDNASLSNEKNSYEATKQYIVNLAEFQETDGQYKGYVTGITVKAKN